ncbi:hypothetical protein BV22DRAFT_1035053 [Leucogyrophana mollusca]|uniref:Uncharacterized protein n=1 Tax=Leucogyrophana mollusca TaxID=85980 RepID=A0ACB8BFQ7_9AGAM|nr:hypothetical protein BV22DRAFT_1035053 [Leucogyrophana mollusca]
MQNHPSYPKLSQLIAKYPKASAALFQVYNDLLLAQRWSDIEVLDLPACSRGAIKGRRPITDTETIRSTCVVVPCSIAESLSTSWFHAAFASLGDPPPEEMYLAITTEDASTVYYKISKGIVKPPV